MTNRGGGDGASSARVATGMDPGVLTQVLMQTATPGDATVMSELTMSVGAPPSGQRVTGLPETTARRPGKVRSGGKGSAKTSGPKRPQCKLGARVCVERRHLDIRVRPDDAGRAVLDAMNNQETNFYGQIVSRAKHQTWNVKVDLFPSDAAPVPTARTHIKRILFPGEEEPAYDREQDSEVEDVPPEQAAAKRRKKDGKHDYIAESIKKFEDLDVEAQRVARTFAWKYGEKDEETVKWDILAEGEQIITCPMEAEHTTTPAGEGAVESESVGMKNSNAGSCVALPPSCLFNTNPLRKDIPWSQNPMENDFNKMFFEDFFPSLVGKAKTADKILHDRRSGYYLTAKANNIRFHDPQAADPDQKVRALTLFFLLLLPLTICLFFSPVSDTSLLHPIDKGRDRMPQRY